MSEMACPDPSAHEASHKSKLSEQASSAALYVTDPARSTRGPRTSDSRADILDADGKLSSRSAATSLKHARAQDLPSFPSHGFASGAAGKAALLAKDYKMKELWQPEASAAGSKAALLAQRDGGKLNLWYPTPTKDGNSAAALAMRAKGLSPDLDRGYTAEGKNNSLRAATLSIRRGRSDSLPIPAPPDAYPDAHNSAANALSAATFSHRASSNKSALDAKAAAPDGWSSEANQAARVTNLQMDPKMFGDDPHIDIDPEDTKHQAALRASAVSMAKQMYEVQNRTVLGDASGDSMGTGSTRHQQSPSRDVKLEALRYINLQDAAHKLAEERLAKVDKDREAKLYREYYGYPNQNTSPRKSIGSRLSIRGRRRAGSDGDLVDSDDEEQARRIRKQMSQLSTGLGEVDNKKRTEDRAKLMAAAEKRVHTQMHDMDEKIFADTGKMPPAMQEEWDEKARKRAHEQRELASRPENRGKTPIGGGKFIDQSELEAIAAARLKPTLDEINDTAERKRARDEELRQEREEQQRAKQEAKEEHRREKEEQKRAKNEEKAAAKKEKEEAKARKSEEKRAAQEENRKSKEVAGGAVAGVAAEHATDGEDDDLTAEKKSGGVLGRFSSKLRRRKKEENKPDDEAQTQDDKMDKEESPAEMAAGTGAAVAGGVAAVEGVDHAESPAAEDKGELGKSEEVDGPRNEVEDQPDTSSLKETEKQGQMLQRPPIPHANTGHYTDPTLSVNPPERKPDLERHISQLAYSDDDLSTDDEDDGYAEREKARRGAERVSIPSVSQDNDDTARDAALVGSSAAIPITEAAETNKADESQPSVLPSAPVTTEPVKSEHTAEQAGSERQADTKTGDETGPAPHTIGPHQSDIANIIDPRVKPDPKKMGKQKEMATAPTRIGNTGPNDPSKAQDESAERDSKGGIRGFFSKLRHRRESKGESDAQMLQKDDLKAVTTEKTTTEAPAAAAATSEPHTAKSTADNAVEAPNHTESALRGAGAVSPSSFERHEGELRNPSDVSSSGVDEEDLTRGRRSYDKPISAYLKAEYGLGDLNKEGLKIPELDDKKRDEGEEEQQQFEEARDYFDESLAPPPSFAGQPKSTSPVRETKFREEV